jgi:hypothetical protein
VWSSALAGTTLYLSFVQSDQFSKHWQDPTGGHEFVPVIDFWISDESGRIVPILEPGTHSSSQSDANTMSPHFQWQGSEMVLPEVLTRWNTTSTHRRPGLLYFWTSVVSVDIGDQGRTCGAYFPPFNSPIEVEKLEQKRRENPETEIIRDAVVVGRTNEAEQKGIKNSLLLLWVEWREGTAYRLGCDLVKEHAWLACQRRQWRLTTLG